MSTRAKLVIANVLMSVGVIPLAFFVVWLIGILTWTPGHQAIIPIMDPLGMIGPFVLSCIFTAAVAGTSAAWSWDLVRANPQSRSRVALGMPVCAALPGEVSPTVKPSLHALEPSQRRSLVIAKPIAIERSVCA